MMHGRGNKWFNQVTAVKRTSHAAGILICLLPNFAYFSFLTFFTQTWPCSIIFIIIFKNKMKFGIDWYVTGRFSTSSSFLTLFNVIWPCLTSFDLVRSFLLSFWKSKWNFESIDMSHDLFRRVSYFGPYLTSYDLAWPHLTLFDHFHYHFWNQNEIWNRLICHMTYLAKYLIFDLVWPHITLFDLMGPCQIVFIIVFEVRVKFEIDWYVMWPISTFFKFLTTPDHSLVITGRSERLETITLGFLA